MSHGIRKAVAAVVAASAGWIGLDQTPYGVSGGFETAEAI